MSPTIDVPTLPAGTVIAYAMLYRADIDTLHAIAFKVESDADGTPCLLVGTGDDGRTVDSEGTPACPRLRSGD